MSILQFDKIPAPTALILRALSMEKYIRRFTLVGGTALALQLGHRQSEDLDFVYDDEKIDSIGIKRFISRLFPDYHLLREEKGYQLDFLVKDVKITFFSSGAVLIPFKVKEYSFRYENVNIADVPTIASLKMSAIPQRCTMRDYYDLYFITKYISSLSEVYKNTKKLFPSLSAIIYTETIIFTDDIAESSINEHLNPKVLVTKNQIAEFFVEEIKKMRPSPHWD